MVILPGNVKCQFFLPKPPNYFSLKSYATYYESKLTVKQQLVRVHHLIKWPQEDYILFETSAQLLLPSYDKGEQ